jgi:hypothetical protein
VGIFRCSKCLPWTFSMSFNMLSLKINKFLRYLV